MRESHPETAAPWLSGGLLRLLGVGFGLAVIVGSTSGRGSSGPPAWWPGSWVGRRPSWWPGSWVASTRWYLLVNMALLSVLSVPALAGSTLPAADAAQAILGEGGRRIITVLSIVSLPPLLNAIMMIGSRVLFAMGRDRLFWHGTARVNRGGTPGVAMLVTTAVAVLFMASATFEKLVAIALFFLAVNYVVSCLALVVLRRREPGLPRPFRAWAYPWSVGVVLAGATAFLAGDTPSAIASLVLLAVGLAGRAVLGRRRAVSSAP